MRIFPVICLAGACCLACAGTPAGARSLFHKDASASSSPSFVSTIPALRGDSSAPKAPPDTLQRITPGRSNSPEQEQKPYVIFISADGLRYDLVDKYHAEHLQSLKEKGVATTHMIPAYPSVTFPNHYTLATGLYPAHHGLVDNTIYDPAKKAFYRTKDKQAVCDSSWYGGIPLWTLAEQQRLLSASFFWVGSEADIGGLRPAYWYPYNEKIPLADRINDIKNWLTLPEAQRPHLIFFYLYHVDHAEHTYGVDSKEAIDAVHLVDNTIWQLTRTIDSLHLPVNYILVSDHGMSAIDTLHTLSLPAAVDTTKFIIAGNETLVQLYAKDKKEVIPVYDALKKEDRTDDYAVYLPDETPARWHYTKKDDRFGRIGDILLVAKAPYVFELHGKKPLPANHGFDNALPDMGATFYAWGPAFKQHLIVPAFENVDVYPLIAQVLGLKITSPIDGSIEVLQGILTAISLPAKAPPQLPSSTTGR